MSKILITGNEGLIGKKVFSYLKKSNSVYGLDKKNNFDLCDESQVRDFFKQNNNFDYLINLHGANEHVVTKKIKANKEFDNDKDSFDYFFKNNVFSFYLMNKNFIKYCKKGKGIINFSSVFSLVSPKHFIYDKPKNIFYVSSKFATNGITKYFATRFGKKININTIACHGVEWKQSKKFKKNLINHIPKKRMMKINDLFGLLDLLCSEKNKFINGSTIVVDGGYTSW